MKSGRCPITDSLCSLVKVVGVGKCCSRRNSRNSRSYLETDLGPFQKVLWFQEAWQGFLRGIFGLLQVFSEFFWFS